MPTYVSLLRGINVTGKNRIPMTDLRALYARHGHSDVVTYVQSGNVVSRVGTRSTRAVERSLAAAIDTDLGLDVAVLVRTPTELRRVLEHNPFVVGGADPTKLHVTFLATEASRLTTAALAGNEFEPDRFRVQGREVYISCPSGYGRTVINNAWFERKLGLTATTRNWNTVSKLVELAGG